MPEYPDENAATFEFLRGIEGIFKTNRALEQQMQSVAQNMQIMVDRMPGEIAVGVVQGIGTIIGETMLTVGRLMDRDQRMIDQQERAGLLPPAGAVALTAGAGGLMGGLIGRGLTGVGPTPPVTPPPGGQGGPNDPVSRVQLQALMAEMRTGEGAVRRPRPGARGRSGGRPGGSTPELVEESEEIGFSFASMRKQALNSAARALSEREWSQPGGVSAEDRAAMASAFGMDPASYDNLIRDRDGNLVALDSPEGQLAMTPTTAMRAAGIARGVTASMASGNNVGGALQGALKVGLNAGAIRALGGIGVATTAGFSLRDRLVSERAALAPIQSQMGGSALGGYRERLAQRGFALQSMWSMDSEMADQLYEGVRSTGLRGTEREEALRFGTDSYRNLGMSVEESMQMVRFAAESGQESLSGLSDVLTLVSSTAREAGVNAEVARKNFLTTWQAATTALGSGPQALGAAGAVAASQARMGRQFENNDFSGQFDTDYMRVLAGQEGISTLDFYLKAQAPKGDVFYTEAQSKRVRNVVRDRLGPVGTQAVTEWASANPPAGPGNQYTSDQLNTLGNEVLRATGMDPAVAQQFISELTQMQMDSPQEAANFMAQVVTGQYDPAAALSDQYAESAVTREGKGDRNRPGVSDSLFGRNLAGGKAEYVDAAADAWSAIGLGEFKGTKASVGGLQGTYLDQVGLTGMRSGMIEKLVKDDKDAKRKYRVQGKDGERIVTGQELITNYFEQAASGKVQIAEGRGAGETISEVTNMIGDPTIDTSASKKGTKGQDAKRYDEERSGSVNVTMSNELRRWLNIQTTGNVSYDRTGPPPSELPTKWKPVG